MAVESASVITALNPAWPQNEDFAVEGDNHIRVVKGCLQTQFAGSTGDLYDIPVTVGPRELNIAKAYASIWGNDRIARDTANAARLTITTSGISVTGTVTGSVAATAATHLLRKGESDTALAGKADTVHTHTIAQITGLQAALDALQAEINDIKNGLAFTGQISAPIVTQTT